MLKVRYRKPDSVTKEQESRERRNHKVNKAQVIKGLILELKTMLTERVTKKLQGSIQISKDLY
jgi:hypothetical protein